MFLTVPLIDIMENIFLAEGVTTIQLIRLSLVMVGVLAISLKKRLKS